MHTAKIIIFTLFVLTLGLPQTARAKVDGDYLRNLKRTYVTPHLKWATPLAGGPVRTLFVSPFGRPAREIARRSPCAAPA